VHQVNQAVQEQQEDKVSLELQVILVVVEMLVQQVVLEQLEQPGLQGFQDSQETLDLWVYQVPKEQLDLREPLVRLAMLDQKVTQA